jgi:ribosomal protein L11 methyltransferase
MTTIAKFLLSKTEAERLASALEQDETLAELPVGVGEAPDSVWQVTIYLSGEAEKAEIAALKGAAKALGMPAAGFSVERLPDTDWVAKSLEGLKPVRAGRFLVHGSHDRARRRTNDIAIEIEAGQAFGTGHHGTTAGCLRAIDRLARSRKIRNALDIGTGSGVLAIAIAKVAKAPVLAGDIDPVAVGVARDNIRLNGVANYVCAVIAANLKKRGFGVRVPFDLTVANILAGPLMGLAPGIARALAPGGTVILSGLLPEQRARIVAAYRGQGLALARSSILDGWLTLTFTRRSRRQRRPESKRAKPAAPPFVIV